MIAPGGAIAWPCARRWGSTAVLAGLLDGGGGCTVVPTGVAVWGGRHDPGTLIRRSRWTGRSDALEVREPSDSLARRIRSGLAAAVRRPRAYHSG